MKRSRMNRGTSTLKRSTIGPKTYGEAVVRSQARQRRKVAKVSNDPNGRILARTAATERKQQGISPKPITPAKRADIKFSQMIREGAGWICARCGKNHSENHAGLEASHFYNVRYSAVRYDPDNVISLCGRFSNPNCHTGPDGFEYQKGDGQAYYQFMVMRLGTEGFFALGLKAARHVKLRDAVDAFIGREAR